MNLKITVVLATLTLALAGAAMPVKAQDRMAGDAPVSGESVAESTAAEEKAEAHTADINFASLESSGILTEARQGGLGRDLWRGTRRSLIVSHLPQLPALSPYRAMQDLSRRLLLTKIDSLLIEQDERPIPGQDITTLRIEKLLEMGAHKEALRLYTRYPGEPYHERLARAGILAAFYNKESPLACLEVKTVQDRFKGVTFWQQVSKICDYILTKGAGNTGRQTAKVEFRESPVLQRIVKDPDYRFKPEEPADFQDISPLEMAVLVADNRLDLRHFNFSKADSLPVHVLSLFLDEPSLPGNQAFQLMVRSVAAGAKSPADLAAYYNKKAEQYFGDGSQTTSLAAYRQIEGWKRLPYLYRAAANAAKGAEQAAILGRAFSLEKEYGQAALWPFAGIISALDPAKLEAAQIRTGFEILSVTGTEISTEWYQAWESAQIAGPGTSEKERLTYFAYGGGNSPTKSIILKDLDFTEIFPNLSSNEHEILKISAVLLDKSTKLHNDVAKNIYEKQMDLTSSVDYVMPSTSLLDRLEDAGLERRPGEIILLSSIALRDVPPSKIYAGLFREVLGGLIAVGLTKEARILAREVVLGLSEK